ncbi:MAG: AAA family ATPase [Flavobacteriales bacterium CG_4_9_14_3_um_filter_32_8]|nr:MAG: AAA family ATPase [Flavobacteriales bacterium CG_4_9_14_3_um_filter_32_8]
MFNRIIVNELDKWANKKNRKPLVLRGARQVGKTTVINQFAKNFEQYIYLNLELPSDSKPFQNFNNLENLVQTLFFLKDKEYAKRNKTLLFIDEIQEVPEAFNILRFFYEEMPEIHVIAAGSLLETIFNNQLKFPVGRVEFLVLHPVSFIEFLEAVGEVQALKQFNTIPLQSFAHDKLLNLFHTYALIGGMPEIIKEYVETKDITALGSIYDSLIASYLDDVEKYATNNSQVQVIRHVIKTSYFEANKRIKFQGFGKSGYGSKEVGEALRTLEKTFLLRLIYPTTSVKLPIVPELQKSPRLHLLDTGLINYMVGVQKEIIGTTDLNNVYNGTVIEHLVGQELLTGNFKALNSLNFWVREKNTSSAELDYVMVYDGKLIPIEVKSGKEGKLKSLHLFMEESSHNVAIRLYAGELSLTKVKTATGKMYHLLNLPYFLAAQLPKYLEWFNQKVR